MPKFKKERLNIMIGDINKMNEYGVEIDEKQRNNNVEAHGGAL